MTARFAQISTKSKEGFPVAEHAFKVQEHLNSMDEISRLAIKIETQSHHYSLATAYGDEAHEFIIMTFVYC